MNWMDKIIEDWHNGPADNGSLHEALGMSWELYARWVEKPHRLVLGIDEVGYGSLAGSLVIGGVLAPISWEFSERKDSKAFRGNEGKAERARARVLQNLAGVHDATYFLHRTTSDRVDELGVYQARLHAFSELCQHVLRTRSSENILVVLDGDVRIPQLDHVCLPKADTFVPQVMAASIVAKVSRDTEMREFDKTYPNYDFGKNKGYNSPTHEEGIRKFGLCPIHRKSFKLKFLEGTSSSPSVP